MTLPTNSLLITFGGQAWTTESWQCRVRARSTTPVTDEALIVGIAGMATAIYGPIATLFHDSRLFSWNHAALDFVKVAALDTSGHYALGSDADLHALPPGTGGVGSVLNACPQVAVVATLRTGAHRGHASRGRMFWPAGSLVGLPATGEMALADAEGIRDVTKEILDSINGILHGAFSSQMNVAIGSDIGAGVFRDITAVSVGRVHDTQRRRRRSLPESYTADAALA